MVALQIIILLEAISEAIETLVDIIPWDVVVAGLAIMLAADALGIYPFQQLLLDLGTLAVNTIVDALTAVWDWLVNLGTTIWNAILDALNPV